jgi:probable rRNA maturation factor
MIDIIINRDVEAWDTGFEDAARRAAWAALIAVFGDGAETSGGTLELGITLSDDDTVRALNRDHRGQDKPTNVLSFPLIDGPLPVPDARHPADAPLLLGDVILAWETVAREALEQGKSPAAHATHLVVHGVLHLLGHDHQTEAAADAMERLESAVLGRLGIADPYAEPPATGPVRLPSEPAPEPP